MKFTVLWLPRAEASLARIWHDNPEQRSLITASASEIDKLLAENAFSAGESRSENVRILLAYPLGVSFHCSLDDRTASVAFAWYYRKRHGDEESS